ncbi:Hypothetical protein SRAE_2000082700 [Strongyloides ratti]|uniref:Uncharacterized protein n=1 Tax=Strongyloides ratti TaxID=34506 RepID=A0A090L8U8_STRRB|nr:Hypothetical protein SRAE_2000082700 [Strongyloides ratti]CEF66157.1 Hypothetical protein SRAE_2000082700 [Strongyloides ratti]
MASLNDKRDLSKLIQEIESGDIFIKDFIKDYNTNGFQKEKFLNFCKQFMEMEEVSNRVLLHNQLHYFSYNLMKKTINNDDYIHKLATLIFKKSLYIAFNFNWSFGDNHDMYEKITCMFPDCNFDFTTLNMKDVYKEYLSLICTIDKEIRTYDDNLTKNSLPKSPKATTDDSNNCIIFSKYDKPKTPNNRATNTSESLDICSSAKKPKSLTSSISKPIEEIINKTETIFDDLWYDDFWKSKQKWLFDKLSEHFKISLYQKENLSSILTTYIKHLIKRNVLEFTDVKKAKEAINKSIYKMYTFIIYKDSGKKLFDDILSGKVTGRQLSKYRNEDLSEKKDSFATNEIIYNSELLNLPAIQTFPCKKCATMHSKNDTCRRDD